MLYYMRKYLLIVNSSIMWITFRHKPCFKPPSTFYILSFLLNTQLQPIDFCFLFWFPSDQVPFFFKETIYSLDASTRFSLSRSSNASWKLPSSGLSPSFTIHISINIFIVRINVIVLQLRKNMLLHFWTISSGLIITQIFCLWFCFLNLLFLTCRLFLVTSILWKSTLKNHPWLKMFTCKITTHKHVSKILSS